MDGPAGRGDTGGIARRVIFLMLFAGCCAVALVPVSETGRWLMDLLPWRHSQGGVLLVILLGAGLLLLPDLLCGMDLELVWIAGPVVLTAAVILGHDPIFMRGVPSTLDPVRLIVMALNVAVAARSVVWYPRVPGALNLLVAVYMLLVAAVDSTVIYRSVGMFGAEAA